MCCIVHSVPRSVLLCTYAFCVCSVRVRFNSDLPVFGSNWIYVKVIERVSFNQNRIKIVTFVTVIILNCIDEWKLIKRNCLLCVCVKSCWNCVTRAKLTDHSANFLIRRPDLEFKWNVFGKWLRQLSQLVTYEYMTHGCCKVRHTKTTKQRSMNNDSCAKKMTIWKRNEIQLERATK